MGFEIYTDALSKQLGSVITQGNRPLAFFSRKLSTTQQKYSLTELELLAIVETLKEFKGMLWGQRLKVYTVLDRLKGRSFPGSCSGVSWRIALYISSTDYTRPLEYSV